MPDVAKTTSAMSTPLRRKAHVANLVGNWYSCCIINAVQHFTMWCLLRSLWKSANNVKFHHDLILIDHVNTCCNAIHKNNIIMDILSFAKYCKEDWCQATLTLICYPPFTENDSSLGYNDYFYHIPRFSTSDEKLYSVTEMWQFDWEVEAESE